MLLIPNKQLLIISLSHSLCLLDIEAYTDAAFLEFTVVIQINKNEVSNKIIIARHSQKDDHCFSVTIRVINIKQ